MSVWSEKILVLYSCLEEKRIIAAEKITPHSLDQGKKSGIFVSSSTGELYSTTLTTCSCMDHRKKGNTCKHMIRLAMELDVPITYYRPVPKLYHYATKAPVEEESKKQSPEIKDYSLPELLDLLANLHIEVDDKRSVGGCIWIENTRDYEAFLSKLTVDGKRLKRASSSAHFKWQFSWYLR